MTGSCAPNAQIVAANDPSLDTMVVRFMRELAELIDGDDASERHQLVASQLRKLAAVLEDKPAPVHHA